MVSFWESQEGVSQYRENLATALDEHNIEMTACHVHRICDVSRVHLEYFNGTPWELTSGEWRDSEGHLRLAVYYEYELDAKRNWTSRKTWVYSIALGERKLYETDTRSIIDWPE